MKIFNFKKFKNKIYNNDILWNFFHSPQVLVAAFLCLVIIFLALFSPLLMPHNPYDLSKVNLEDSRLPPAWVEGGKEAYLLGTDDQGRDLFSTIFYGTRLSLLVGFGAVFFSLLVGITLGMISGYAGGIIDTIIMRIADIQLSFPAILIALLADGIARSVIVHHDGIFVPAMILIISIGISGWVRYARTIRAAVMVEKKKEYIQAAMVMGLPWHRISMKHILPNVLSAVTVIATLHLATAVMTEATLSFLGVGIPPTNPSLGSLIKIGNEFLFSGSWWISIFPGFLLVLLILSVNILGDFLRDAFNPKLR